MPALILTLSRSQFRMAQIAAEMAWEDKMDEVKKLQELVAISPPTTTNMRQLPIDVMKARILMLYKLI